MSPVLTGLIGLVLGAALGSLATWRLLRPAAATAQTPAPAPPGPSGSEEVRLSPVAAVPEAPADAGMTDAITASRRLVEDMERRYAARAPGASPPEGTAKTRRPRKSRDAPGAGGEI